ncbi:hypothetical protein FRC02_007571 [Tulasnella sp. 418]|nr:hypothetical protein FRC02_007571 [Tulasnella sp. 418]
MSQETFENDMAQNRHSTDTAPLSWLKYGGANPLLVTRGPYGPPPTPHLSELQLTSSQELVQDQATESPPSEPSFFGSSKVTRKSVSEGVNEARTGSIKSDDQLFREFHGRQFNAINSTYHLPADMEEHERLSIQHRSLCLLLGNLYTAEDIVEAILKPNDDYTPMILDLGTGM